MFKKILPFLLIAVLCLSGCGEKADTKSSSDTKEAHITQTKTKEESDTKEKSETVEKSEEKEEPTEAPTAEPTKAIEKSGSDEVKRGPNSTDELAVWNYTLVSDYGSAEYISVITNETDKTLDVDGTIALYDKDGKLADTSSAYIYALAPGATYVMDYYISDNTVMDKIEESLKTSDSYNDSAIDEDCAYSIWCWEENAVVGFVNNSDKAFEYVTSKILFFDADDNVVEMGTLSLGDAGYYVKPGDTFYDSYSVSKDYDHAEAYFTGTVGGETENYVDVDSLEITELVAQDSYFDTRVLVVKNTTDKDICVGANIVAVNSDETPLDADITSSFTISAGETGLLFLDMYDLEGVEPDEYYYSISAAKPYAKSIVGDITYTDSSDGEKVKVKAKNNASSESYVWGYVLFLDKDGNLLDYDMESFSTDDSYELQPGQEVEAEFTYWGSTAYDSYLVFFEADVY